MHDNERRSHNRKLAVRLAEAGIYVFPSLNKNPIVPGWQKADTSITPEDRATAVRKFITENDREPLHVGCTIDPAVVKRIWKASPDAVPSISCGPSGLIVLDCDKPRATNAQDGVANIRSFFEDNGKTDLSDLPITNTQSKGRHIYFRNIVDHGCASGAFRAMNIQVKGIGGQIVAPGAVREDGAQYEKMLGTPSLIAAFVNGTIPDVPSYVVEHFNTKVSTDKADISTDEQSTFEQRIEQADLDDYDDVYGPLGYDLDSLKAKDSEFARLMDGNRGEHADDGDASKSGLMFTLARCLHREFGNRFTVEDFAALLINHPDSMFGTYVHDDSPGDNEFNTRNIARDFLNARNNFKVADTQVLGTVDEDDGFGTDTPPDHYVEAKRQKNEKSYARETVGEAIRSWTPVRWLVRDFIPRSGVATIYGASQGGKSFLAIDIAMRVARGMPFFGKKTNAGGVLYFYGEGKEGWKSRFKAWYAHNRMEPMNAGDVDIIACRPNMHSDVRFVAKISRTVKEYREQHGVGVVMIVIDTFSAHAGGLDENSASEVAALISKLHTVSLENDCVVVFVHHTGKDDSRGIRGSSVFTANVDAKLIVRRNKKGRVFEADKQRDGASGVVFPFDLKRIVLGVDEDAEEATSMVVRDPGTDATAAMGAVSEDDDVDGVEQGGAGADASSDSDSDRVALEAVEAEDKARRDVALKLLVDVLVDPDTPRVRSGQHAGWTALPVIRDRHPYLDEFVKKHGPNFARAFTREFMHGQTDVRVENGRVWFKGKSGGSVMRFEKDRRTK